MHHMQMVLASHIIMAFFLSGEYQPQYVEIILCYLETKRNQISIM